MKYFLNILITVCLLVDVLPSQHVNRQSGVEPNFRIYPSSVTQTEVFVTKHPLFSNILFSSANTINLATGFISEGIYVSLNGGVSWTGTDTCKGAPVLFHKGDPGIAIDKNGTFLLTRLGFQEGLFSHFSTDSGKTWSPQRTIAGERQDRASLTTDVQSSSQYSGRSYTTYVELLPPFPVKVSSTQDGGTSWTSPQAINNPIQRSQGAEIMSGNDGSVFVVWAAVQSSSPYTEDFIGTGRSSDGGVTWIVNEQAIDINGIQGVLSQKSSIRVNGLPKIDVDKTMGTRRGWIYIVTTQKNLSPAGSDPDIILYRSTNDGQSWSSGIRVNQDPLNNGKIQYFPAIHIDDTGGVNVLYYDDRETTSDSAGVYLSRSVDGGDSWSDYRISDHNFLPKSIGGLGQGYQGDNISLISVGSTLIPMWMDNSSGIYQIWIARVPLSSITTAQRTEAPVVEFTLDQNYPNPFNPSTTISYGLSVSDAVSLIVYDQLGRKVAVMDEGKKESGAHRMTFTMPSHVSSGIYFYRLTAGIRSLTKKMIYQK